MLRVLAAAMLALAPGTAFAQPNPDDSDWRALADADRDAADPKASGPHRAESLRRAGELRLSLGDFPGAETDFRRALELLPGDSGLLLRLAEALHERPELALPFADRAASAAGASAAARADGYLLAGRLRLELEDAAGAEKSLALALSDAPDDLDALHAMARVLRARKPAAFVFAERAERAAAKSPPWRRPAALRLAARVWLELDEHARAAENFRLALLFNPEDLDALGPLVRMKDRLAPGRLAGLRRAALAAGRRTELETEASSEEAPLRALASAPDDLEALRRLVVLHRERRPAEAAAYAARFGAAVPRSPVWQRAEAYRELARLWSSLGDAAKAQASIDRAHDGQSDSLLTWRMIDALPPPAKEKLNQGGPMAVYCAAAEMRLALGDRAGAEEVLALALRHEPGHAWALRLKAALEK